jgi:hypothetical protein
MHVIGDAATSVTFRSFVGKRLERCATGSGCASLRTAWRRGTTFGPFDPNVSVLPQSPRRPQRKTRYSLGIQGQHIFRVGTLFPSPPKERTHRVWLCDLGDLCGEKSRFKNCSGTKTSR